MSSQTFIISEAFALSDTITTSLPPNPMKPNIVLLIFVPCLYTTSSVLITLILLEFKHKELSSMKPIIGEWFVLSLL